MSRRPTSAPVVATGRDRRSRALGASLLAIALGVAGVEPASTAPPRRPWLGCGTGRSADQKAARATVAPGTLLFVRQEPRAVHHGYAGALRYRDLAVLGDFTSIELLIESLDGGRSLTVERRERHVNSQGDVISLFELEGTLSQWVSLPWNWDIDVASPLLFTDLLYLGPPGSQQPIYLPLTVLPKGLPRSKVVRIAPDLQYASHVLNVALADFRDRQLEAPGGEGFTPEEVIARIEEAFGPGAYDEYGFGIWEHQMTHPGAYHRNNGSGLPSYSSFVASAIAVRGLWSHEINHNWNFRYDLPALVGWSAPFDGSHSRGTVAEEAGFLCCGAYPVRRVDGRWRTVWIRDPHPFHPLELFAMGLIGADEVPVMRVFKRQDLPDHRPGEVMRGPSRELTVDRIVEEYGLPEPAARGAWRVAPVIVSERLLPKKLLSKLNFYLRRIEDPDGDVPASFDRATGGRLDLVTSIAVGDRRQPRPPKRVAFPEIGSREIPGVTLDRPLPGCVEMGDNLIVEGRSELGVAPTLTLVPSNPDSERTEVVAEPLAGGRFRAVLTPRVEDLHRIVLGPVLPVDGTARARAASASVDPTLQPGQVRIGPIYVLTDCP